MKQTSYHKWQQVYLKEIADMEIEELMEELVRVTALQQNQEIDLNEKAKLLWKKGAIRDKVLKIVDILLISSRKTIKEAEGLMEHSRKQIEGYEEIKQQLTDL